jgi:tRNA(fMet)-specific endonuclease VapC
MAGQQGMILCDTNILIEFYKGNRATIEELRIIGYGKIAVSVITKAEILYGARNRKELDAIDRHLSQCVCYKLTAEISGLFVQLMRDYSLRHKSTIPDLLIAATAIDWIGLAAKKRDPITPFPVIPKRWLH